MFCWKQKACLKLKYLAKAISSSYTFYLFILIFFYHLVDLSKFAYFFPHFTCILCGYVTFLYLCWHWQKATNQWMFVLHLKQMFNSIKSALFKSFGHFNGNNAINCNKTWSKSSFFCLVCTFFFLIFIENCHYWH